jgi:WhiB family redox-sensing transcriptional regulator
VSAGFDDLAGIMAGATEPLRLSDLLEKLRPSWMRDALCREYPDLEFIPRRGKPTAPAKAVCGSCLVQSECLAYALEWECVGIWAGTTERERRASAKTAA